jgi:hypothetical protein
VEKRRPRARRRIRIALAVVLVLDLAVLGTDVFLLSNRSSTTAVDLQDALVTFRSLGGATPVTSAPAGGVEVTAPHDDAAPVASTPATQAATTIAAPTAPPPAASPTTTPVGLAAPAEGVYSYRTSGGESITVLGAHHDYPTTTYAAVHRTGGCGWQIRAEVVKEHVDERTMCSQADGLLQLGQTRQVEFFGNRDGGSYTCAPPQVQFTVGDAPGGTSSADCADADGGAAHLVRTFLGASQVTVGGVAVEVVRIRIDGTITGRARGTSSDTLTLVAGTGLPVRWERSVDTVADAFGASVRYVEHATFDLTSLTPQT